MCEACPPAVLELALRIGAYAERHGWVVGGGLHIVIEDENVADHHITWCQQNAELDAESAAFATELLAMTVPERHQVIRLAWDNDLPGYLTEAGIVPPSGKAPA